MKWKALILAAALTAMSTGIAFAQSGGGGGGGGNAGGGTAGSAGGANAGGIGPQQGGTTSGAQGNVTGSPPGATPGIQREPINEDRSLNERATSPNAQDSQDGSVGSGASEGG